jgi:hypothetical protein
VYLCFVYNVIHIVRFLDSVSLFTNKMLYLSKNIIEMLEFQDCIFTQAVPFVDGWKTIKMLKV